MDAMCRAGGLSGDRLKAPGCAWCRFRRDQQAGDGGEIEVAEGIGSEAETASALKFCVALKRFKPAVAVAGETAGGGDPEFAIG